MARVNDAKFSWIVLMVFVYALVYFVTWFLDRLLRGSIHLLLVLVNLYFLAQTIETFFYWFLDYPKEEIPNRLVRTFFSVLCAFFLNSFVFHYNFSLYVRNFTIWNIAILFLMCLCVANFIERLITEKPQEIKEKAAVVLWGFTFLIGFVYVFGALTIPKDMWANRRYHSISFASFFDTAFRNSFDVICYFFYGWWVSRMVAGFLVASLIFWFFSRVIRFGISGLFPKKL